MPSDVSVLEMHILITRIILITNSILITFVLTLKSQRYNFKLFFYLQCSYTTRFALFIYYYLFTLLLAFYIVLSVNFSLNFKLEVSLKILNKK